MIPGGAGCQGAQAAKVHKRTPLKQSKPSCLPKMHSTYVSAASPGAGEGTGRGLGTGEGEGMGRGDSTKPEKPDSAVMLPEVTPTPIWARL